MISGKIRCLRSELDLGITLNGGQSFRWAALENNSYRGVFSGIVWTLSQTDKYLCYTVHTPNKINNDYNSILSKYFRLETCLQDNVQKWIEVDDHFKKHYNTTVGVRILHQDVIENLFAFICSSNNNITRITSMVEKLCLFFGKKIGVVDSKEYYDFPTVEALTDNNVESVLREKGFGYRAKYIANTARDLNNLGGKKWLMSLHKSNGLPYEEAKKQLMTLTGIGPKVADCICLMSLGYLNAIPVDTHIFQVARINYMPHLISQKTVTLKLCQDISNYLQDLWGPLAGWAQCIVFCAKINNIIPNANKRKGKRKAKENSSPKIKKENAE